MAAALNVEMVPMARVKLTIADNFKYITDVMTKTSYEIFKKHNEGKEPRIDGLRVEGIMLNYDPDNNESPLQPAYFFKKYNDPNALRGFFDKSTCAQVSDINTELYGVITDADPLNLSQDQFNKEKNRLLTFFKRINLDNTMENSIVSNIMRTEDRNKYLLTHDGEEPPMEEEEKFYKILHIVNKSMFNNRPGQEADYTHYIEYARSDIDGNVLSDVNNLGFKQMGFNDGICAKMIIQKKLGGTGGTGGSRRKHKKLKNLKKTRKIK
jgi:hypothetical protein